MDNYDFLPAILSFIFVIGLLLVSLWFLRTRKLNGLGLANDTIKIIEVVRVDQRNKLVVVNYSNRRLLLGVSANQVSLLDSQLLTDVPESPINGETQAGGFKETFHKLLKTHHNENS